MVVVRAVSVANAKAADPPQSGTTVWSGRTSSLAGWHPQLEGQGREPNPFHFRGPGAAAGCQSPEADVTATGFGDADVLTSAMHVGAAVMLAVACYRSGMSAVAAMPLSPRCTQPRRTKLTGDSHFPARLDG